MRGVAPIEYIKMKLHSDLSIKTLVSRRLEGLFTHILVCFSEKWTCIMIFEPSKMDLHNISYRKIERATEDLNYNFFTKLSYAA